MTAGAGKTKGGETEAIRAEERRFSLLHRTAVLFPLLLGLAIVLIQFHRPGLTADGVTYLQIARNILFGQGLGWQASWVPPLHSMLIAAASYLPGIGDLLTAAGIVSSGMYLCLVVAVYLLARELFDLRTALVASFFTALSPHLITIAFSPEAEITYTFFLTLSLLLAARNARLGTVAGAAATGVSFALAWMARSEGIIVMACLLAGLSVLQGRSVFRTRMFRNCLVTVLFFMLTAAPYLLFLKAQYGTWVISPKSSYVQIWMKSRIYHDNNKGERENDELWGLTPDGTKLLWQVPKGIGDLAGYLMGHPEKSLRVYLHNLGMELPGRIPNNSGMERFPQLYPVYLALAALLAVFLPWGERAKEKRAVLLTPFLILLILPVFTEGWWKYLVPYLPVVMILAARGITGGASLLAARVSPRHAVGLAAGSIVAVTAIVVVRFWIALHPLSAAQSASGAAVSPSIAARRNMVEVARLAGEWGAARFGPGKNYMVRWDKIVYYLDGIWTAFPVADVPQIMDYARRNKVDYIVLELDARPDRESLLNAPAGLRFAGLYDSDRFAYVVVFYRVLR